MNQMACNHRLLNRTLLAAVAFMMLGTGCAAIAPVSQGVLPTAQKQMAEKHGTYSIESHPSVGKPKQIKGVLTGSKTVSEALAESGIIRKYSTYDIEVLRVVQHKGANRGLRMPIEFDAKRRGPSPEQDYALLDGDRIVIKPEQQGGLVKALSRLSGQ